MSWQDEFDVENGVLRRYLGRRRNVTVPDWVTDVGDEAFFCCMTIRRVLLPEGLRSIGRMAFSGCAQLQSVRVPDSVTAIGDWAFTYCSLLSAIRLPEGLQYLGMGVFSSCRSLLRLDLPPSVTEVKDWSFNGCRSLQTPGLSARVNTVSYQAFSSCSGLQTVRLPEGVTAVGSHAFSNCGNLLSAYLPDSVTSVGDEAFGDCPQLAELRVPEGRVRWGRHVFSGCRALADESGFIILRGVLQEYAPPDGGAESPKVRDVTLPDTATDAAAEVFSGMKLVLRVRRWFPGLAAALEGCELLALVTEEPSPVPPRFLRAARIGAALGETPPEPEALTWLRRHAASLCREALELPQLLRFLCEHRLLPPGASDDWLAETAARKMSEPTALLLEYQAALGPETMRRARAARRGRRTDEEETAP